MELNEIKTLIHSGNKGSFRVMETCKSLKTRKTESAHSVVKVSRQTVRFGCRYDNLKAVQEKRESGELPETNAGLPWGEWLEEGYLITHKGNVYLRVTSSPNKPKTTYLVDGKVATEEQARALCLKSEFHENTPDCYNVKISNIVTIK